MGSLIQIALPFSSRIKAFEMICMFGFNLLLFCKRLWIAKCHNQLAEKIISGMSFSDKISKNFSYQFLKTMVSDFIASWIAC
jgi:hypothetical protein